MGFIDYPSPTPQFPALPVQGFPVKKTPIFSAFQHRSVSGKQYSSARQAFPNWTFELQYGNDAWLREQTQNIALYRPNSPYTEFEAISQLFLSCYGKYGEFWYDDPEDDSRAGQPIATGNGAALTFRAVRTWGLSPLARIEPVGAVNSGQPWKVYENGVDETANYSLSADSASFVRTGSPPASGVAITADFSFLYRCHFAEDNQQYDQFLYQLWQLGQCKFMSVKP